MRLRQFTARQRQIILLLMNRLEGMTAAEIAAETGVSVRTVHREMDEIEKKLKALGAGLHKKSGTGIRLGFDDPGELERLRQLLLSGKPAGYSIEERKILVLCELLDADEPIKLFALGHSLKVTVATISNDLDELESWTNRFDLRMIRRRGYGVELEGEEGAKRRAIRRLAIENLDYSDMVGGGETLEGREAAGRLLSMIGKPLLLNVEKTLWDMNWEWTEGLSESAYTEMLIALSIAVSRIRQGRNIEAQERVKEGNFASDPLMADARAFAAKLEAGLELRLSEPEIAHIGELFDTGREMTEVSELAHTDLEMVETVNRLMKSVMSRTGIPFQEDRILREGLVEHIGTAMKRIRAGTRIRNPLLSPIRKDYEDLFRIVRQSVDEIISEYAIPDEEIGFLVMHFGASIERLNQLGLHLRAILVCSSGLSSSRLLGTRLGKEMPQIEVLGNISWYEAARIPEDRYDLIISTIDLPLPDDKYVRLSPLLTPEDKEKLLRFIQRKGSQPLSAMKLKEEERGQPASLEQLRAHADLMNEVVSLLDGFHVCRLNNAPDDLAGTVDRALAVVSAAGGISDAGHVARRLLDRERMGSQLIPETSLALFHTRSRSVVRPTLMLFRLAEAAPLEDGAEAEVLLLMLAPKSLPKESLEVLSEISAMLLQPELIELMEQGGEEEIKSYLAKELQHFFNHTT